MITTQPFDAAEFVRGPEDEAELFAVALESGDAAHIKRVLGVLARAHGMSAVARDAGVTREALYKAFREDGDPKLSTVLGVVRALGLRLSAA